MSPRIKSLLVRALELLPPRLWPPASAFAQKLWPGFRDE